MRSNQRRTGNHRQSRRQAIRADRAGPRFNGPVSAASASRWRKAVCRPRSGSRL